MSTLLVPMTLSSKKTRIQNISKVIRISLWFFAPRSTIFDFTKEPLEPYLILLQLYKTIKKKQYHSADIAVRRVRRSLPQHVLADSAGRLFIGQVKNVENSAWIGHGLGLAGRISAADYGIVTCQGTVQEMKRVRKFMHV
ncbi:MAG: hypothetical protein E4H40_04330 [Candidatus Brocadiia bacterium]|nr:MAG: hypothetical protein E4H40_04330 [Candidatus Brocadiia bacterium]